MKRIATAILSVLAISVGTLFAATPKIGGTSLKSYTIVYSAAAEAEVGAEAAEKLSKAIEAATGTKLSVRDDSGKPSSKEILVGETNRPASKAAYSADFGPFEYKAVLKKGRLVLAAGGCWALDKVGALAVEKIAEGKMNGSYREKGSVEGEYLFPRDNDINLRILDDNVWDYSKQESPQIWKDAGLECTDDVRAPQFAQIVRAYMPDVMGFQEFSMHMREYFNPLVAGYGYKEAFQVPEGKKNDTPVYYNENTVELITSDYVLFTPKKWSNHNSKSYTWALFRLKADGKQFILLSTHLWWKSDKVMPGSTQARAAQVRLIMAEVEGLKAKYNCPVFVVGDMNCWERSTPIKQFIKGGYEPCYKLATGITSTIRGHHVCGPKNVGCREKLYRPREEAIDHCLLYNGGNTVIRNFICETSAFSILLTDHCPNIIDAIL